MDPRHLVQLAAILEKGSITQASRHLHPARELAGHVAVARIAGHAVAVLVRVDQLHRFGEVCGADA